jgi:AcrR family transcriptional regulator
MKAKKDTPKSYHHGDLRNTLRDAARAILEEEGLAALSLRAVARRAGVSHAAPYRHFPNHEALLVELVTEGFAELRQGIAAAVAGPARETDRITAIGAAYMRFVTQRPGVARLMFGSQIPNRDSFPELGTAADSIGQEISAALINPAVGIAWAGDACPGKLDRSGPAPRGTERPSVPRGDRVAKFVYGLNGLKRAALSWKFSI